MTIIKSKGGNRGSIEARVRSEYEACRWEVGYSADGEDWALDDAAAFCAERVGCSVAEARAALISYFPGSAQ